MSYVRILIIGLFFLISFPLGVLAEFVLLSASECICLRLFWVLCEAVPGHLSTLQTATPPFMVSQSLVYPGLFSVRKVCEGILIPECPRSILGLAPLLPGFLTQVSHVVHLKTNTSCVILWLVSSRRLLL